LHRLSLNGRVTYLGQYAKAASALSYAYEIGVSLLNLWFKVNFLIDQCQTHLVHEIRNEGMN
jgi:hypothetical protein